jgi:hypothetical protein
MLSLTDLNIFSTSTHNTIPIKKAQVPLKPTGVFLLLLFKVLLHTLTKPLCE